MPNYPHYLHYFFTTYTIYRLIDLISIIKRPISNVTYGNKSDSFHDVYVELNSASQCSRILLANIAICECTLRLGEDFVKGMAYFKCVYGVESNLNVSRQRCYFDSHACLEQKYA